MSDKNLPLIGEREAEQLKKKFAECEDRELIRELVRRGRFHVTEATSLFYNELVGEERYMESITHNTAHMIARNLLDKGHVLIQDRVMPTMERSARRASVVVLRERGVKPDGL